MNAIYKQGLLGLGALLLAGAALADDQASTPAAPAAGHPAMHAGMHRMTPEQMKARMAKHAAQLHDKLKLTPEQEPAWTTFVAAMTPPAGQWNMADMKAKHAEMAKLSAPELMEKHVEMMKKHEERATAHLAAVKTFYAVLTPEQQKIFNESAHHLHDRFAAMGAHRAK